VAFDRVLAYQKILSQPHREPGNAPQSMLAGTLKTVFVGDWPCQRMAIIQLLML
jgi:hypothetical protein